MLKQVKGESNLLSAKVSEGWSQPYTSLTSIGVDAFPDGSPTREIQMVFIGDMNHGHLNRVLMVHDHKPRHA